MENYNKEGKMEMCKQFIKCLCNVLCFACCTCTKNTEMQNHSMSPILWSETTPFLPPVHQGQVIKVYDGDTITIAARLPYPESPLYRFQVRLLGIDSPEIKGKTKEEQEAAKLSQKELETLILQKVVYLKDIAQEKYGRILANVYVDYPIPQNPTNQIHLNQWMIHNGYAVPYDGKTKTPFSTQTTF